MKSELGKLAKGVSSEETDTKNPGFIDKIVNSLNKIQRESFIIKGNGSDSVICHLSTKRLHLKFSRKGFFAFS